MTVKEACGVFAAYKEVSLTVDEMDYQLARKDCSKFDPNMMQLFGDCIVDYVLACEEGRFLINVQMEPVRAQN